jgi:DNA replication protein DnaC
MRRYTQEMFSELKRMRKEIVEHHEDCHGAGFVETDGKPDFCICTKVFSYVKELVYAEIPRTYWTFKLAELKVEDSYKKFIHMYFENLDNALIQALGIIFLGPNGVGKTAMMCEIGKEAIVRGIVPYYITTQRYINMAMKSGPDVLVRASSDARIVLLDEVDKAYIKEGSDYVPKTFEDFLRATISSGRIVIAASNEDEAGLESLLGQSTLSMVRRHLKIVPVAGEDFSDNRQDNWSKMLKEKTDWFHVNIVEMAERRHDNLGWQGWEDIKDEG